MKNPASERHLTETSWGNRPRKLSQCSSAAREPAEQPVSKAWKTGGNKVWRGSWLGLVWSSFLQLLDKLIKITENLLSSVHSFPHEFIHNCFPDAQSSEEKFGSILYNMWASTASVREIRMGSSNQNSKDSPDLHPLHPQQMMLHRNTL